MACTNYKGADFLLYGQWSDAAYPLAHTVPDAWTLKFSEANLRRNPVRQVDPTINNQVLDEKSDEIDETPDGTITTVACLNDALYWLHGLFGAPSTAGAGPYVHTFTMTNDCKPHASLELKGTRTGGSARIRQYLGMMVKDFSWDVLSQEQNFIINMLMARQTRPHPSALLDATPDAVRAKARAQAAKGEVYDVSGSNTLGTITGATWNANLNLDPKRIADGSAGYGAVLPGGIQFSGQLTALMTDSTLDDFSEAHTTKKVVLKTQSIAGTESLVITMPSCEFDEAAQEIKTKHGIIKTYNYKAHWTTGDAAVTAVLTNAVAAL